MSALHHTIKLLAIALVLTTISNHNASASARQFIISGLNLPLIASDLDTSDIVTSFTLELTGTSETATVIQPDPYFTGPNASEFYVVSYPQTYTPAIPEATTIKLIPTSLGYKEASFILHTDQTTEPLIIPMTARVGYGIASGLPNSLNFGRISVIDETTTHTITLTNTGNTDLQFTGAGISISGTPGYSFTDPISTAPLAPLESRAFAIQWTPASSGTSNATCKFTTDDPYKPEININLSGFASTPNYSSTPSLIEFGQKVINEPVSDSQVFRVNSRGQVPLQFRGTGLTITGPDSGSFVFSTPPDLSPLSKQNEIRDFHIAFVPTTIGSKQATLTLTTNVTTPLSRHIPLSGTAIEPRETLLEGRYTGVGPGRSTIGIKGDYTSLHEACQDTSIPLTGGNWDYVILNDLDETDNSFLAVPSTNGNIVTFRPVPDTSVTITFKATGPNYGYQAGFGGHFGIGIKSERHLSGAVRLIPTSTSNIIVDGSSLPGGLDQSLLFRFGGSVSSAKAPLIKVVGDADNVQIKNCRFEFDSTGMTDSRTYAVGFSVVPIGSTQTIDTTPIIGGNPDFGLIENCDILSTGSRPSYGMAYEGPNGGSPVTAAPVYITNTTGLQFINNTIRGNGTGILFGSARNSLISSNTIQMFWERPSQQNLVEYSGISISNSERSGYILQPFDVDIKVTDNIIRVMKIGTQDSMFGIYTGNANQNGQYLIANNMITGLSAPTLSGRLAGGITYSSDVASTAVIAHNSIHLAPSKNIATEQNVFGIGEAGPYIYPYYQRYMKGTMIIRNNIIRVDETSASAIVRRTSQGTFISDYNNISTTASAFAAHWLGQPQESLVDYQTTSGQDIHSITQNPFEPAAPGLGTWTPVANGNAGETDLHFTVYPGNLYHAPKVPGIDYDIDGQPRNETLAVIGADEVPPPNAAVARWELY